MKMSCCSNFLWVFISIVTTYALIIPLGANFGMIDDHGLLDTVLSGKIMDFFIIPRTGRFYPLDGQEYNIISYFSSSPVVFYAYNMLQFLFVIFIMLKILKKIIPDDKNQYVAYGCILLLIFSPGFVTAWFRLFVPERGEIVFFLLFIAMYISYQKRQSYVYMITGLASANIALYYKEPAFLMLGAFAFFHLVFTWKNANIHQKLFDGLIILSSLIFILIYFFIVYLHKDGIRYGITPYNQLIIFAKNIFNSTLYDPFLIFSMLGLFAYRAYEIITRKDSFEPLYDSMLIGGTVYLLVFLKLNMWAFHYLLPAYAFAIFGMIYFFIEKKYIKKKVFKILVGISFIVFTFNALPRSIHLLSHYKNTPNNFQNTLNYLVKKVNNSNDRISIYLDGVNRGSGIEIYHSIAKYLEYRGIDNHKFDLKSDTPSDNSLLFSTADAKSPFTVYNNSGVSSIVSGDLLIITPYTTKYIDQKYIKSLKTNYDLLYHSKPAIDIPCLDIKTFFKYLTRSQSISNELIRAKNVFSWSDFYVFQKK